MAEKKMENKPKTPTKNVKKTTTSSNKKETSSTVKKAAPKKNTSTARTTKPSSTTKKKTETIKKTSNNSAVKNTAAKVKSSSPKNESPSKTKLPQKQSAPDKIIVSGKKTSTKTPSKTKVSSKKVESKVKDAKSTKEEQKETIQKKIAKKKIIGKELTTQENNQEVKFFFKNVINRTKKLSQYFFLNCKKGITYIFQNSKKWGSLIGTNVKKIPKFIKQNTKKIKNISKEKKKSQTITKEKSFVLKIKKRKRFLFLVAIFCFITFVLLKIPYGISTYQSGASNKILDVPRFVKLKEECCNYNATFSTPRSLSALKKDIEKIINGYEKMDCDGKTYYYNEKQNYTIIDYRVEKGIFLNRINIVYGQGNSCDIDTKFKKLELLADDFSISDAKKDGNYVMEGEKVYNKQAYDAFMKSVSNKEAATLRIVTTNQNGDVLITDLEYLSSGKYLVSYDGTRDKNTKNHQSIIAYKFDHLKVVKDKLYAYNGEKPILKKAKKYETYYLLTLPKN